MIERIVILGGGSAGFLTAITLRRRLPQVQVTVLRSREIGIIGVGEGSTPSLTLHLHGYLQLDPSEFYREAEPSWKLGIKFLWGKRPCFFYNFQPQYDLKYHVLDYMTGYYCEEDCVGADVSSALTSRDLVSVRVENGGPYIGTDLAYHLENELFVKYLEKLSQRLGVTIVDDTVDHVEHTGEQVQALVGAGGRRYEAELFVDCSGFRSLLLGRTLGVPHVSFEKSLFCDRAVVGGWTRTDEIIKPYTTAEQMEAGWCWQIEHERRINRGYVYSSKFISDAAAEVEFRRKNPKLTDTRVVPFTTGRRAQSWKGNVVAIGNAAGFVEPLEATALGMICSDTQALAEGLSACDCRPGPMVVECYNKRTQQVWEILRDFLALHYKFNTYYDTPFWQACRNDIDLLGAQPIADFYREQGPSPLWRNVLLQSQDIFDMDGYFALLIGMQVPYQYHPVISAEDAANFEKIREAFRTKVATGMTVAEAMSIVRSPNWQWDIEFFKQAFKQMQKR